MSKAVAFVVVALEVVCGLNLAHIRVSESITQPVESPSGNAAVVGLTAYMRLPASQYVAIPLPLSASLDILPGTTDRFRLCVPPLCFNLPGLPVVEATPTVLARVSTSEDRVVISSNECSIAGSPLIEKLRLNERYNFSVETCFTWRQNDDGEAPSTATAASQADGGDAIFSSTTIEVDVDPPGPFALMPRFVLEAVGNSVMALALTRLQTPFVANLAADYARWSSDEAYREERSAPCRDDRREDMYS